MGTEFPDDLEDRLLLAQEETAVPVRVLSAEQVLDLLLDHLGELEL
jgi:hypothetical protein